MDQINELEKLIDRMVNINVERKDAIPLINKYVNNIPVNDKELIKIYSYLSEFIAKYETELSKYIDPKEKQEFHEIINKFKNHVINLTPIESYLIDRYDRACLKELEESSSINNGFTKRKTNPNYKSSFEESIELNPYGITLIPIIITVTVLIGTIIAAILLVK